MKPNFEKILPPSDLSFSYFVRQEREFPFNWHHHYEYELTAICSGRGRRFVGDGISNYKQSDLVLIGANVPHTWQSEKTGTAAGNKACVIQFDKNFLGDVLWNTPEFKNVRILLNKSAAGLCFHGPMRDEVIAQMFEMDSLRGYKKLLSLLDILGKLGKCSNTEKLSLKVFGENVDSKQYGRIDKVLEYISQNYDEEISLAQVADSIPMSVSAFSRFFKRTTGKNYVNYLNEIRINSACALLIETDMSMAEICFKSGFQSVANFNRRFQQVKKMSPKKFRSQFCKTTF